MTPFLSTFGLIVVAEMADKTQLLALTFAARHRLGQVAAGILLATAVLGGIAVALGEGLTRLVPMAVLKTVAGGVFLAFAAWTLLVMAKVGDDGAEGADDRRRGWPVFATVAVAFFLAELGDKTQLAAVALAARYASPIAVWGGFTLGMAVADGLGLALGRALGPRLPRRALAMGSAAVFALFGILTLVEALRSP